MAGFGYSIINTLDESYGPGNSQQTAAKALRALGLTTNAPYDNEKRVYVYVSSRSWGVDVPADRAEEFARELWKDDRTTRVTFSGGVDFPKPAERTVADVEKELADFKKKVAKVALQAKRENDWCDPGFERAMKDLGLEIPATKVRVVLEIDLSEHDLEADPSSLNQVRDAIKYDLEPSDTAAAVKSVEPIKG